jgi:hypothetical protein
MFEQREKQRQIVKRKQCVGGAVKERNVEYTRQTRESF